MTVCGNIFITHEDMFYKKKSKISLWKIHAPIDMLVGGGWGVNLPPNLRTPLRAAYLPPLSLPESSPREKHKNFGGGGSGIGGDREREKNRERSPPKLTENLAG